MTAPAARRAFPPFGTAHVRETPSVCAGIFKPAEDGKPIRTTAGSFVQSAATIFEPLDLPTGFKVARQFESSSLRHTVFDLRNSPEKAAKFTRVRGFPQSQRRGRDTDLLGPILRNSLRRECPPSLTVRSGIRHTLCCGRRCVASRIRRSRKPGDVVSTLRERRFDGRFAVTRAEAER
jgi:hypothetical protein